MYELQNNTSVIIQTISDQTKYNRKLSRCSTFVRLGIARDQCVSQARKTGCAGLAFFDEINVPKYKCVSLNVRYSCSP